MLLGPVALLLAGCASQAEKAQQQMLQHDIIASGSRPYSLSRATPAERGTSAETQASFEGYGLSHDLEADHPRVAEVVSKYGPPDAVEVHKPYVIGAAQSTVEIYIALFYRNPPRTLLYLDSRAPIIGGLQLLAEISQVPRSTRRQAFGEGPMPPPWPVTIPLDRPSTVLGIHFGLLTDRMTAFGVPAAPSAPQPFDPTNFMSSYRPISEQIQLGITIVAGEPFERASRAFTRLKPDSILPGFNWRLIVFRSDSNYAFSVPDGTIFVSDGLVSKLSDDELVAVFAHVLGHVAYGHDRWFWQEANVAEKTGAVVGAAVLVAAVLFLSQGQALPRPQPPPPKHFGVYSSVVSRK